MSKVVKNHIIAELEETLQRHGEVLVVDVSAMSGVDANVLRVDLVAKGIGMLTVKNSLARRACENVGLGALASVLDGPSTLVWGGEDIVALSREITKWAKQDKTLQIKGGAVEGSALDAAGVDRLSKSPGRLELLSIIAGAILGPGGRVAGALLGPGGTVVGAIKSIADGEDDAS
jgi:large subunit ribosomal protein L10